MTTWKTRAADCGYLEILTTGAGIAYGCRLHGASRGPQLAVTGIGAVADRVFDDLLAIPTLPWMRGRIVFIRLDALDGGDDGLAALGPVDRTVTLPFHEGADAQTLEQARGLVLDVCANLGMIAGRGLPPGARPGPVVAAVR